MGRKRNDLESVKRRRLKALEQVENSLKSESISDTRYLALCRERDNLRKRVGLEPVQG